MLASNGAVTAVANLKPTKSSCSVTEMIIATFITTIQKNRPCHKHRSGSLRAGFAWEHL